MAAKKNKSNKLYHLGKQAYLINKGGDNMKATVKVQQTKSNTGINFPKSIREIFKVTKGETLIIETVGDGEITIKKI